MWCFDHQIMRKFYHTASQIVVFSLAFICALALSSCKKKTHSNIIIVKKPVEVKAKKPQKIGDATSVNTVKWQGNTYKIETSIKADTTLPLASDGTSEFYDNRVNVRILRSDGSEFFAGSFTKSNFKSYVDESYYKNGALLGIVFDKVVGNQLRFAASVGSPDKSSDEYVPLVLTVNNLGTVSISKYVATDADDSDL